MLCQKKIIPDRHPNKNRSRSLEKEANMEIKIKKLPLNKRKKKPTDESKLGFGKIFTDHMFSMKFKEGKGWHNAVIEPYHDLKFDNNAICLHYCQEIF